MRRRRAVRRLRGIDYPAHELSQLTGLHPAFQPERRNLVLVDTDSAPSAVLVDAVLDANELVTRPAGQISQAHSRRRRHRPLR